MKYSVIFPYRDRLDHLMITLPRIHAMLTAQQIEHELIIVEQHDKRKFRRANLLNDGVKVATGDVVVLHDIDYYPVSDDTVYYDGVSDIYLPVRRVEFVHNDLTPRPTSDIPGGYRHFKIGVDADFFGGISTFVKSAFFKMNGFSHQFTGWGFEDADLRERVQHHKLSVVRSDDTLFYALEHVDSGPAANDPDFHRNIHLWHTWKDNLRHGVNTQTSTVSEIDPNFFASPVGQLDIPCLRWVRATGYDPAIPLASSILASRFNFDEGEE